MNRLDRGFHGASQQGFGDLVKGGFFSLLEGSL